MVVKELQQHYLCIFLNQNKFLFMNGKQIISNSTLVAITIMIAESNPREKDIMVHLVMNILQERN